MITKTNKISFQGDYGANSDMASRDVFPTMEPLPCQTFEDAFAAIDNGEADLGMIPIENTIAGRVADIHHLLPESRLHIVGEYFMPIHFQLMVLPGVKKEEIRTVHSHIHALGQCRKIVRANGWKPVIAGDTAGAAKLVQETGDRTMAALAPRLAADLYGLEIVAENVEDTENNVTRFVVLSRDENWAERSSAEEKIVTTFVFNVRNIPAALYKAIGRLCHQRHQHDEARKLSARRPFCSDAVLRRYRGPSVRCACAPGAGGIAVLFREGPHSGCLQGASNAGRALRLTVLEATSSFEAPLFELRTSG